MRRSSARRRSPISARLCLALVVVSAALVGVHSGSARVVDSQLAPATNPLTLSRGAAGRSFVTRSTRDEIIVDVCSNCHPAYIGTERRTQSGSRIERFERRRAAARR